MDAGLPLSADVVERTPPEVIRLLQQLLKRIDKLEAENRELKARLGLNSSNSSKPPSTDPPSHKRKPPGTNAADQRLRQRHKAVAEAGLVSVVFAAYESHTIPRAVFPRTFARLPKRGGVRWP